MYSFNNKIQPRGAVLLNLVFLSFKLESILEQLYFPQYDILRRGEQCAAFSQETQKDGGARRTNYTST